VGGAGSILEASHLVSDLGAPGKSSRRLAKVWRPNPEKQAFPLIMWASLFRFEISTLNPQEMAGDDRGDEDCAVDDLVDADLHCFEFCAGWGKAGY